MLLGREARSALSGREIKRILRISHDAAPRAIESQLPAKNEIAFQESICVARERGIFGLGSF
jgi:hypothetical protein